MDYLKPHVSDDPIYPFMIKFALVHRDFLRVLVKYDGSYVDYLEPVKTPDGELYYHSINEFLEWMRRGQLANSKALINGRVLIDFLENIDWKKVQTELGMPF